MEYVLVHLVTFYFYDFLDSIYFTCFCFTLEIRKFLTCWWTLVYQQLENDEYYEFVGRRIKKRKYRSKGILYLSKTSRYKPILSI